MENSIARPLKNTLRIASRSGGGFLIPKIVSESKSPVVLFVSQPSDAIKRSAEITFFDPSLRVRTLPDWETLPYDAFSPHQDLISERLETLYHLTEEKVDLLIVPISTALHKIAPKTYFSQNVFLLNVGERLSQENFRDHLSNAGYEPVSQVVAPGEYSIRGSIIDVFPMGSILPYRIDLLDDEIDSIRTFDVDTQRSIYKNNEIRVLPAREFPTNEDAITLFRSNYREMIDGDPTKSLIYREVSKGSFPSGIEYYLPLFFNATGTIFDYIPENAKLIYDHDAFDAIQSFWNETESRYRLLRADSERPLLDPSFLFLREDQFFGKLKSFDRTELEFLDTSDEIFSKLPDLSVNRRLKNPLGNLKNFLNIHEGRCILIADSPGRKETISELLGMNNILFSNAEGWDECMSSTTRFCVTNGSIDTGFIYTPDKLAVITEGELYPQQTRGRGRNRPSTSPENVIRDLSEIRIGDPIVHLNHGIGRYRELSTMDLGEGSSDFLCIEYAEGAVLYVPVGQLDLVSRYSGGPPELAPLHKLGTDKWDKAKRKAAEKIRDTAAELLGIYAQRAALPGRSHSLDRDMYEAFCEEFPFEETVDQQTAITATIEDLQAPKPMDRLICGDVGFGKTEVALRAAFVAVSNNYQVAVLVPTTLLAEQHYQTFVDRFKDTPVRIAELSRFRSKPQIEETCNSLENGKIDIVIGTHKILSKDVRFKSLGLVIIDEEHRFGVRQKEVLKALRTEVDILTLTATPIPRTLAMSMEGLRDLSVIATPPRRRLAIKTFVNPYSEGLIREAIIRELKRGGQIFYLYNEVDSIESAREKILSIIPSATVRIAHGQMRERELEIVMRDFYQGRFNILLCTTIIETGIDIPNANTIIIDRADKFGLAQLHQLRGRVGRSHHQAFAYLLTPRGVPLKGQAKKRLEAIQMMEELGSGFFLAMHDLEIRGAGEVLGDTQSGDLQEIGYQLYTDMLNRAVKSLKNGKEPILNLQLQDSTDINLHTPTLLPNDYCPNVHQRLIMYKRLAGATSFDELENIQEEIIDRFGPIPPETKSLVNNHRLRILGQDLGVTKIDSNGTKSTIQFLSEPKVDPMNIIECVQRRDDVRFSGADRILLTSDEETVDSRFSSILTLLAEIQAGGALN